MEPANLLIIGTDGGRETIEDQVGESFAEGSLVWRNRLALVAAHRGRWTHLDQLLTWPARGQMKRG